MLVKNLVVGGCSFTGDGIGGCPPTLSHPGGCSYIFDPDYQQKNPNTWAGFAAQNLGVTSMLNLACISHGNLITHHALISVLEKFPYTSSDTLILFDISYPERYDVPCEFSHPDASKFVPWGPEIIPHSYLDRTSGTYKHVEKNVGLDIITHLSLTATVSLLNYLEYKKFCYAFVCIENFLLRNDFYQAVKNYKHNCVMIEPGIGLKEYAELSGNQSTNLYHPDLAGYQDIAQQITRFVSDNIL